MRYRVTLLAVFFLTVVFDLTVAVEVGLVAACITFIYRISSLSRCEPVDFSAYPTVNAQAQHVAGFRLYGALFFGAVKLIEDLREQLPKQTLLLDLKNVIYIDSSGAETLNDLAHACSKNGVQLLVCGLSHQPLDIATRCGFVDEIGTRHLYPDLATGMAAAAA
jgi:sulfate permease, SulP family